MSRDLLLAPEWLGHTGLWLVGAKGTRREVTAEEIGLSDDLADEIEAWIDCFDALYDEADPDASDFATEGERLAWLAEGAVLQQAIADELGGGWTVTTDFESWRMAART